VREYYVYKLRILSLCVMFFNGLTPWAVQIKQVNAFAAIVEPYFSLVSICFFLFRLKSPSENRSIVMPARSLEIL